MFIPVRLSAERVEERSLEEAIELTLLRGERELANVVQPSACSPKPGGDSRVSGLGCEGDTSDRAREVVSRRHRGVDKEVEGLAERLPRLLPSIETERSPATALARQHKIELIDGVAIAHMLTDGGDCK